MKTKRAFCLRLSFIRCRKVNFLSNRITKNVLVSCQYKIRSYCWDGVRITRDIHIFAWIKLDLFFLVIFRFSFNWPRWNETALRLKNVISMFCRINVLSHTKNVYILRWTKMLNVSPVLLWKIILFLIHRRSIKVSFCRLPT